MQGSTNRQRFREIDVLRGAASLWVMLSHYLPHWKAHLGEVPIIIPNSFGLYAVELFFVISGFVIFMTLDRCESVADFAVLRFSRLYPAYWATLILATLISVFLFGEKFWAGGFIVNATMFQELFSYPDIDDVYWSLTVELVFYLNAAWLLALGWHRNVRVIMPAWLIAALVWAAFVHPVRREYRDMFATFLVLDYAPYFATGIVFFDAVRRGWSVFSSAMMLLAIVTEFTIAGSGGVCVLVVVSLLMIAAIRGYISFLVSRMTLWLGAISFSLYLLHRRLGYEVLDWMNSHQINVALAVPFTMASALLLATLVTYGVERPSMKIIRTWYEKRRSRC